MMTTTQKGWLVGSMIAGAVAALFNRVVNMLSTPTLSIEESRARLEESMAQASRGETIPFDIDVWESRIKNGATRDTEESERNRERFAHVG